MDQIKTVEIDSSSAKLRIFAAIDREDDSLVRAELPQREIATLLPRDILLGEEKTITSQLLETIGVTTKRLLIGRKARVWEYNDKTYFGFPTWRTAKVLSADPAVPGVDEYGEGGRDV